jgi:hypothetical protein
MLIMTAKLEFLGVSFVDEANTHAAFRIGAVVKV